MSLILLCCHPLTIVLTADFGKSIDHRLKPWSTVPSIAALLTRSKAHRGSGPACLNCSALSALSRWLRVRRVDLAKVKARAAEPTERWRKARCQPYRGKRPIGKKTALDFDARNNSYAVPAAFDGQDGTNDHSKRACEARRTLFRSSLRTDDEW